MAWVMFPQNINTGLLTVSFILLFCSLVESRSFYYLKRDGNPDVGCKPDMNTQDMNTYLKQMVRCLASVARPRFGKRSGNVFGRTIESEENKTGLTPMGYDISEIRKRLLSL